MKCPHECQNKSKQGQINSHQACVERRGKQWGQCLRDQRAGALQNSNRLTKHSWSSRDFGSSNIRWVQGIPSNDQRGWSGLAPVNSQNLPPRLPSRTEPHAGEKMQSEIKIEQDRDKSGGKALIKVREDRSGNLRKQASCLYRCSKTAEGALSS